LFGGLVYLDYSIFHLEDGAGEGALAPVVEAIWISSMSEQELDEVGMAVIRG